jgi:hypothetical protein
MAMDKPSSFDCPNCGVSYQLVRAEAGPETADRHVPAALVVHRCQGGKVSSFSSISRCGGARKKRCGRA